MLSHSSPVISQNLNFSLIAETSPPLADEGMVSIVVIAFKVLIGGTVTDNTPGTGTQRAVGGVLGIRIQR